MNYNVLELFAGCGGLGYGFEKNGFNVICANELEEPIANTYKENFKHSNVIVGDITSPKIKNDIYKNFKDKSCDIVIGGPPCVAYSMSGNRNSRDPRGQLFRDYLEIVKVLSPKVFVMENVKGILTMLHDKDNLTKEEKDKANKFYKLEKQKLEKDHINKKFTIEKRKKDNNEENTYSEEEHKKNKKELTLIKNKIKKMTSDDMSFRIKVCDKIVECFSNIGYDVKFKLHNAANFGVPQRRERVIFIGVKKELNIDIQFPKETHSNKNTNLTPWITVKDAIDDLKNIESNTEFSQIYTKHNETMLKKIEKTPIGKSVNPKYTEAFFRCDPNLPSGTVKENHGGVFVHYEKNRVMTPRELARLQSFPDDFIFKGSKASILKQLGNAVPCQLSNVIAKTVKDMLK